MMVNSITALNSVEADLMSLLSLAPKRLLNIRVGDQLYDFIDDVINSTSANVTAMVTRAMAKPLQLLALFNEYSWLLTEELDDYLENISIADPSPTYDDYCVEFEVLDKAILGITNLSFDYESYDLVRVATTAAKDTLLEAANARKTGLANILCDEARQVSVDVLDGYRDILNRIAVKPADERQLASLREFIEVSKKTVEDLKGQVDKARRSLHLLESVRVPISIEDMALSLSTLEYPAKVEASGKEVEIALDADKVRMMDKLALEKEAFDKEVESLGEQTRSAKVLDDYPNKEKVVEIVNGLMDKVVMSSCTCYTLTHLYFVLDFKCQRSWQQLQHA